MIPFFFTDPKSIMPKTEYIKMISNSRLPMLASD